MSDNDRTYRSIFRWQSFKGRFLFPTIYARFTWDLNRWFVGHWLYDLSGPPRRSIGVTIVRNIKIKIISITFKILNLPRDLTCSRIKGPADCPAIRAIKKRSYYSDGHLRDFIRFIILNTPMSHKLWVIKRFWKSCISKCFSNLVYLYLLNV